MTVRIFKTEPSISEFLESLQARSPGENLTVMESVRQIVKEVRTGGKQALLNLRERFEQVAPDAPLLYRRADFEAIAKEVSPELRSALKLSIERVRRYHEIQRDSTRQYQEEGCLLQSRVQPLDAVALYVPGGTAFYPSSVVMSAVPALVAGVERVGIFTPARSVLNPAFAATIVELGINEVYAVGGAQAVATATFGVEGIERFDKIVGPGNIYVATAKQLLAGRIGIDSYAGPSEILVLSDGSSPAHWIAADLLAQAEHDPEASSILATTCEKEAQNVIAALEELLPQLGDREAIARESLTRWGAILVVKSRDDLLKISNNMTPEHLHIHTECALTADGHAYWTTHLKGVGAIFLGRYTAESFGDYLAGPSHVLPTAGSPRFASPLGVYDFTRRSSVISFSAQKAAELAEPTALFARAERLWAHAKSAELRREGSK